MPAQWEIQKAVYNALDAALATDVLDTVPDEPTYPYTNMGEWSEEPWDTDDSLGRETEFNVHSWSRYDGMKELKDMMDAIKAALHNATLTVTGQTMVMCYEVAMETMLDPDGRTRHGVQRFRITTEGT